MDIKHEEQLVIVNGWLKVNRTPDSRTFMTPVCLVGACASQSRCSLQAIAGRGICCRVRISCVSHVVLEQFDRLLLAKIEQPGINIAETQVIEAVTAALQSG